MLSVHEAPPTLAGHETLLAAARCPEESYSKRRHKADAILRSAQEHLEKTGSGSLTYVDTTHVFLKSFSDVVMVRMKAAPSNATHEVIDYLLIFCYFWASKCVWYHVSLPKEGSAVYVPVVGWAVSVAIIKQNVQSTSDVVGQCNQTIQQAAAR